MEENRYESREKIFLKKIREYDEKTHLSIYLGAGLYQLAMGLVVAVLISFILGLPIIMAYPYINSILLWILKIYSWLMISLGIFTILSHIIIQKTKEDSALQNITKMVLKINRYIMILVPFGRNASSALNSELRTTYEEKRKDRTMARSYFSLLFGAGFIHALLGALIIYLLLDIAVDNADLLYPYINDNLLIFLRTLGWISLIPGMILILCSFASIKLGKIECINDQGFFLKLIRNLILISSVFIVVIFPFGTFYGLIIIQEFYHLKKR